MVLSTGDHLGRYEILAPLGAGGMGEVYRARDTELDREVAIKVLPGAVSGDAARLERFKREVKAVARLSHSNILEIHDFGTHDRTVFAVTELLEGEDLGARLVSRCGPLPWQEIRRIGAAVSAGLAAAHDKGVVHRDLKPANIFLCADGRVKILDFGLARIEAATSSEGVTQTFDSTITGQGTVLGTVGYMSPEQVRGRRTDHRSDIFSLGCVLHEMASGRRPFARDTAADTLAAILNEPPPPLPAETPTELQAVIERCLAKNADLRFQSAREVLAALETLPAGSAISGRAHWSSGSSARPRTGHRSDGVRTPAVRMAVLPFANLTGDPEQEHLSDGITQEMISQLGRLHPGGLSVIARSSVMRYKGGDTPVDQIGRELRVAFVLEGSARREEDRVRITAELIQVEDQTLLWAETYERELAGILALQSEVAQEVARALALELLPREEDHLASVRTVDPEAHDAYLKGSYHWPKLTPEDIDTAERYFELARGKDPSYAPAYQGHAAVWMVRQQMGIAPPNEAGPKAKASALRAVALDDRSAEAHDALAMVRMYIDWDWAAAEHEFKQVLEINPNAASAQAYYAHLLAVLGRADEGLSHGRRALELDPFNALFHAAYAMVLYIGRRYDDALAAVRAGLAIQRDNPVVWNTLQQLYASLGMHDELLATRRQRIAHDPGLLAAFEQGLAESGARCAHRRVADLMAHRHESHSGGDAFGVARRYVDADDHDRAIVWLERAYEEHDPNLLYIASLPFYDPLRSDSRFQDLVRRMNLPLGSL